MSEGLFMRRVRGFRVIEVWLFGIGVVAALGVFLAKASASTEGADIARAERSIAEEHRKIRLLEAEVSYLEQPERIERLAGAHLGLAPVAGAREVSLTNLRDAIRSERPEPTPVAVVLAAPPAAAQPLETEESSAPLEAAPAAASPGAAAPETSPPATEAGQ